MIHESHDAFVAAVEPLRGALRVHCYRMLGSSHDGDDVVQETMLRAWLAKESLDDPSRLRPWLYRIATNVCLDELKKRPKRLLGEDYGPPMSDPTAPLAAPLEEPIWLEPISSAWLSSAAEPDPAAKYTLKESVALAFVAALQCLSAPQRATLLLRDVVGLSAEEAAKALGTSVSAANSALFRARTVLQEKLGGSDPTMFADTTGPVDEALLERYVRAFEAGDLEGFVAVMHEGMRTTMPPIPLWIQGAVANEAFYRHMFPSARVGRIRLLRTAANGQPAFGFYRRASERAPRTLHAIQLIAMREGRIWRIDHFMMKKIFPPFGLPNEA